MDTTRKIKIDPVFLERVNNYRALLFEAEVINTPSSPDLKEELLSVADEIRNSCKLNEINLIPAIKHTREAYKACGKDPNRYRPSQEQLMRRIVKGLGIYSVNTIVDTGNVLSLKTGCSVGCFDAKKVNGDTLYLGIGKEGEPYEGIGRGQLNIAGLPVFRDNIGGIGTPTSDNERTKISIETKSLLVTVHLFDPEIQVSKVVELFYDLFTRHANADKIKYTLF